MDQAFLLRAQRLLDEPQPARFDHQMLVAVVVSRQTASPTARAQARCGASLSFEDDAHALADVLFGREGWQEAAAARHGCFNRAAAARTVNAS